MYSLGDKSGYVTSIPANEEEDVSGFRDDQTMCALIRVGNSFPDNKTQCALIRVKHPLPWLHAPVLCDLM